MTKDHDDQQSGVKWGRAKDYVLAMKREKAVELLRGKSYCGLSDDLQTQDRLNGVLQFHRHDEIEADSEWSQLGMCVLFHKYVGPVVEYATYHSNADAHANPDPPLFHCTFNAHLHPYENLQQAELAYQKALEKVFRLIRLRGYEQGVDADPKGWIATDAKDPSHIGLVYDVDITGMTVDPSPLLLDFRFMGPEAILGQADQLDDWSKVAIKNFCSACLN